MKFISAVTVLILAGLSLAVPVKESVRLSFVVFLCSGYSTITRPMAS